MSVGSDLSTVASFLLKSSMFFSYSGRHQDCFEQSQPAGVRARILRAERAVRGAQL